MWGFFFFAFLKYSSFTPFKAFSSYSFTWKAVAQRCSVKKVFLEISQNSQGNTSARVSFLITLHNLAQVFSCEFCETSKNTFPYRTPPVFASVIYVASVSILLEMNLQRNVQDRSSGKSNYNYLFAQLGWKVLSSNK